MGQVILRKGIITVHDAGYPSNDRMDMVIEDGENLIYLTLTVDESLALVRAIGEEIGYDYFKTKMGIYP